MTKQKRNWAGVGILLVLLGLFPVLSYVYMKAGFDYQVDARSELQELGQVPSFPEQTIFEDTLTGKDKGAQVRLLSFFDPENEETKKLSGKYLSEIHEQFDDVDWFRIELLVPAGKRDALQKFVREKGMEDRDQVFFYATQDNLPAANQQLRIGTELQSEVNVVALADTSGMIVNYYDLTQGKQFVRLVEHIAMLRPQEEDEREEAMFRREREL